MENTKNKKLEVNRETCIGCVLCTTTAEKNFKMEGDKAVVTNQPNGSTDDEIGDAISLCPTSSISFVEQNMVEEMLKIYEKKEKNVQ